MRHHSLVVVVLFALLVIVTAVFMAFDHSARLSLGGG
jgi:hypothetical protein